MKKMWVLVAAASWGLGAGALQAGTLTATITGVPALVPVSPLAPTPATTVQPSLTLTHSGMVGAPDFTMVSVAVAYSASELTYLSSPTAGWSCSPSSGVVDCSGPDLPVNDSTVLQLVFEVRGGQGTSATQMVATPFGMDGGTPVFVDGTAAFSVTDRTDLLLQTPAPVSVAAGGTTSVEISVSRNAADPAHPANLWTNLRVGLNLPAGLRYLGAAAPGWFCPAASVTPGGTFQCVRTGNQTGVPPETLSVQVEGVTPGVQSLAAQLQHDSADFNTSNNVTTASVTVGALPANVSVSASAPATVVNGAVYAATVTTSNAGPGPASAVQTDVQFGAGLQVVSAPAGCVLQSGTLYRCTTASLAPSASSAQSFSLRHTAAAAPAVSSTASVTAAEIDPDPSNNNTSFATSFDPAADLQLSLSDTPDPVDPGAEFLVQAAVRNVGPDAAGSVTLLIPAPSGGTFAGIAVPNGPGIAMTCALQGPNVQCTTSLLAVGQTALAAVRILAPQSGSVITTASVASLTAEVNPTNNSSSETTLVRPPVTLQLSKTASASLVTVGEGFAYTLRVDNQGSSAATGLVLLDPLPQGLDLVEVQPGPFTCSREGLSLDCRLSSLAAGGAAEVVVSVRAPQAVGTLTNTASVSATQTLTTQSATAVVTVSAVAGRADVGLSKRDTVDPVRLGAEFAYVLEVRNLGTTPVAGLTVTDPLPAGVVLLSVLADGWSCSGAAVVVCNQTGSLNAGASAAIQLTVRAPTVAGSLTNTATVSTVAGETDVANNVASESTTIRDEGGEGALVDLALSGTLTPATVNPGGALDLGLQARNLDSSVAAREVDLCVQTQGNATLQTLSAPGISCALTAGGTQAVCRIGTLNPAQALSFAGALRVAAGAAVGSAVGIDAQLGCGRTDPRPEDNSLQLRASVVSVPVDAPADVVGLMSNTVDPVALGTTTQFRIEARNDGPGVASGLQARVSLPAAFRYERFTGAGWTCNGGASGVLECQRAGSLAASSNSVILIDVTAIGLPGQYTTPLVLTSTSVDPQPGNNQATLITRIGASTDANTIAEQFAPSAALDPIAADAAPVVADICANPIAELAGQCNTLIAAAAAGDRGAVVEGLRALFPEEVIAQSVSLQQAANTQFGNVDARLNELRNGAGGFSVSGLALGLGQRQLPLSVFKGVFSNEDDPEVGGSGDLISPWGGFISGTLARGEQDTGDGSRRVVSDFQSYGLTAGVDYRRSARWVIGAALGYADFDSDVTDQGQLSTKGYTLTGYTSWYPRDRVYLDARLSWSMLEMDMTRRIRFGSGAGLVDRTAEGSTDSNQLALAMASGYHISRGTWTITPNASLRYVRSDVDGFTETGAGANNAIYAGQDIDSLQLTAGVQINKVFSLANGVITPQFDFSFTREMRHDDLVIEARLVGAAADQIFRVRTDDPDQTFGNVGIGFVYVGPNGRQAYVSYRELLGADGLERGTLTIGGRFEF